MFQQMRCDKVRFSYSLDKHRGTNPPQCPRQANTVHFLRLQLGPALRLFWRFTSWLLPEMSFTIWFSLETVVIEIQELDQYHLLHMLPL